MNTLATCKNLTSRSTLWWQKVQEKIYMDDLSMFAMFAGKKKKILTWKNTSRQNIWKESQSPATSARRCSGQEIQRLCMFQLTTKVNKSWSNEFSAVSHSISSERGMVCDNIKPRIFEPVEQSVWLMKCYFNQINTYSCNKKRKKEIHNNCHHYEMMSSSTTYAGLCWKTSLFSMPKEKRQQ